MSTRLQLENRTAIPFTGWLQRSIADPPEGASSGTVAGMPVVLGQHLGLRGRRAYVLATLPAGTVLEAAPTWGGPPPALPPFTPADLLKMGIPTVNGVPLVFQWAEEETGGPRMLLFRARVSRMLVAFFWTWAIPGQGWGPFRLILCASNPGVPDMGERLVGNVELRWGNALVHFLAGGEYFVAMKAGDSFGDGQARGFMGTVGWAELTNQQQRESALAFLTGAVGFTDLDWANDVSPLREVAASATSWPGGLAWQQEHFAQTLGLLGSWWDGPLGIVARSGNSGEQEDQGYGGKGTAIFEGGGLGASLIIEIVGLNWLKRPCHYLEADGSPIRLDIPNEEEGFCIWDGRPVSWCRDQRGKPRPISEFDTKGWLGPDNQHDFINTVAAAFQVTGDPMAGWELDMQARVFLYSQSLNPRLATSMPDASRAWGWQALKATWLWITLPDRELARLVRERFVQRMRIYRMAANAGFPGMFDVRFNDEWNGKVIGPAAEIWTDPSTPTPWPRFWLSYQAAQAAGFLDIAGEIMDIPEARQLAIEGALGVMERCYEPNGTEWEMLGVKDDGTTLPPTQFVDGRGAHRSGDFATAWLPLAPWTVLRHQPDHARARFLFELARNRAMAAPSTPGHPALLLEWIPKL